MGPVTARAHRDVPSPAPGSPPDGAAGRFIGVRLAGAAGLAGVLAAAGGVAGSAVAYPGFSLWYDNLSALGVGSTAPLFNTGLLAGGALMALMAVGILGNLCKGRPLRRAGAALLAAALALLAAVGILTEDFGKLHFYTAAGFFSLLAASSLLLGLSLFRDPRLRWPGRLALFSAFMGVSAWFLPGEGWAISELAAAVPGMLWVGALAWTMAGRPEGNR